jgi:hypothetical protein
MTEDQIRALIDAIYSGGWGVSIGLILMAVVFLLRKLLRPLIPKSELALFTAGVAVLCSVGVGLAAGVDPLQAVLIGVLVGTSAVGFWEILGKRIKVWVRRKRSKDAGNAEGSGKET